MKDIAEFEKLFRINIPIFEHVNYYLETLKKSIQFLDMDNLVSEFEQYEDDVISQGYHKNIAETGEKARK